MEDEPRIAKQYESHYYCVCKNNTGKVMEDGRKCLHYFSADQEIMSVMKKYFLGQPIAQATNSFFLPDTLKTNKLRHSKNAFQTGTVNFTNAVSTPSTVRESMQQPRDLSNAG